MEDLPCGSCELQKQDIHENLELEHKVKLPQENSCILGGDFGGPDHFRKIIDQECSNSETFNDNTHQKQ